MMDMNFYEWTVIYVPWAVSCLAALGLGYSCGWYKAYRQMQEEWAK